MDSCRRKSKRKTRKGCKERKGSANKKNMSSHKKFTLANTTNMQHENDRMKKIFDMVQSTSSTFKPGSFHNENIFKAIQSRMINSKGSKSKTKENGTPKSSKKKSCPFTQRTSSLKVPVAVSGYSTTAFSPREYNQIRKEREQIYSPTSMKSMTKKKGSKNKNSTSKKRDSVGNLSKHFEDFTLYSTKGKQFKNNSSIVKNSSRGHTRSSFIHSHKRTSSRTSEIYNSGGSRKRKSKRTSTLISKDLKSNSNISFMKKNQKTIFKILNSNNKLNKIVPTIPSKSDRSALGSK